MSFSIPKGHIHLSNSNEPVKDEWHGKFPGTHSQRKVLHIFFCVEVGKGKFEPSTITVKYGRSVGQ